MGPSYKGGGSATERGNGSRCCRSGPRPRKRSFRSRRFRASIAFGAMGPSYKGGGSGADRGNGSRCCRSGPRPRKRLFRSRRFHASTALRAMGPSYRGCVYAGNAGMGRAAVGAGHARESDRSGRDVSVHRSLSGPWAPPTRVVDPAPNVGMGRAVVGAGHARESHRSRRNVSVHRPPSEPSVGTAPAAASLTARHRSPRDAPKPNADPLLETPNATLDAYHRSIDCRRTRARRRDRRGGRRA